MGKFQITDAEKTKYIQFDEDTEVLVKLLRKSDLREISNRAAKRAKLTGAEAADISDMLLVDAAIKGWRKIGDIEHAGFTVNGAAFPYSQDNARMLMAKSLKFSRFVNECSIDEDEFLEDTDVSKNG